MGEAKRRKSAGTYPQPSVRDNLDFIHMYNNTLMNIADLDWVNQTAGTLISESEAANRPGANMVLLGVQLIAAHLRQTPTEMKDKVWMALMAMTDHQVRLPGADPDPMPNLANIVPESGRA